MKVFTLKSTMFLFLAMIVGLVSSVSIGCKKENSRDKFLGSYNVNENCNSGNYTYSITITASVNSDDGIVIGNFGDFGVNIRGTVAGDNVNINDTQDGITFSGSGNISGNTLTIIYTASQGGTTDNCTKTCIRQ